MKLFQITDYKLIENHLTHAGKGTGEKQKRCPDFTQNTFLLGYSDSNQEKQDQNLLCYHYTIAQ